MKIATACLAAALMVAGCAGQADVPPAETDPGVEAPDGERPLMSFVLRLQSRRR
jgi:hypothetical protein